MLAYNAEVKAETAAIYHKLAAVIPEVEWPFHAPLIAAINRLKRQKNAVILAHNYQTPEIYHGVADIVGDSLHLAYAAAETKADIIIMAGVYFMAETCKLLSPEKTVLIPDNRAGCSLAASITGADVRLLRQKYPGVPVVTYVNSSAEVKAESDICITSGNAVRVVESLGVDQVICLPDAYLADYIATQTKVKIIRWQGHCEVHERFTGQELRDYRSHYPDAIILAHPECPPDVLLEADFVGSTAKMSGYVREKQPGKVLLITECSMSDNVAVENPGVEFIRPCNLCPHMKRITLQNLLDALQGGAGNPAGNPWVSEVTIPPTIAPAARLAVARMLAVRG